LVGGAGNDVTAASPVLAVLGSVRHVGQLGSASRLKLVANSMLADIILAAAELQVAGENAGLDPDEVFWALRRLVPSLEPRRDGFVEGRHVPTLFALRDLRKDLDLAMALFSRSVAETPITRSASELIGAAAASTPDLDITAVARPYRRVRPSPMLQTAAASGASGKTE
jgi:3-hydroxyisobutyrate dehydrogenase